MSFWKSSFDEHRRYVDLFLEHRDSTETLSIKWRYVRMNYYRNINMAFSNSSIFHLFLQKLISVNPKSSQKGSNSSETTKDVY